MSKDLTQDWKNGELPEGGYYVKLESGKIDLYFIVYDDDNCDEIVEVLAPVPSYEKYKSLETGIILADILIKNTKEENDKLKELLKECRVGLLTYSNMCGNYEIYDKIDEVLNVAED